MSNDYRVYLALDLEVEVIARIKNSAIGEILDSADEKDVFDYHTMYIWYEKRGYSNGILDDLFDELDEQFNSEACPYAFAKESLDDSTDVFFRGNDQDYDVRVGAYAGRFFSPKALIAFNKLAALVVDDHPELITEIRKGMW